MLPESVLLAVGDGPDVHCALELARTLTAHSVQVQLVRQGAAAPEHGDSIPVSVLMGGCWNPSDFPGTRIVVDVLPPRASLRLAQSSVDGVLRLEIAEDGPADAIGTIIDTVELAHGRLTGDLTGMSFVVTAGGTREPLDPIRFITNRSSGKMGHALARAARDRGATVTLITTAGTLPIPMGVQVRPASSVESMRRAVLDATVNADVLIMSAAVSDFRPAKAADGKIKKTAAGLTLELSTIDNFIPEVPTGVLRVGFAAETNQDLEQARLKMKRRGFDLLCLNDVSQAGVGFETDTNKVWILDEGGTRAETGVISKLDVAHRILDEVVKLR